MLTRQFKRAAEPYLAGKKPTFATILVSILLKAYGAESLNWENNTIELTLKEDFGVEMPRRVFDKMMALLTSLNSNIVYQDVSVFDHVVHSLCGQGAGVEHGVPPVLDIAWAVTEIEIADPAPVGIDPKKRWSDTIKAYIRVALDDEGMAIAPKALNFIKDRPAPTTDSDALTVASSWQEKQSQADEIDEHVEELVNVMVAQLATIGIALPKQDKTAAVNPRTALLKTLSDGTKVEEVDGATVRDNIRTEFIGGGNHEATSEIPKNEIWLENNMPPEERSKILLHELVERALLRQNKQKGQATPEAYDKAHDEANKIEGLARGLKVQPKTAEWTSPKNEATHVEKHAPEFGGQEGYRAAEKEHSEKPPEDSIVKDQRCKTTGTGVSCTTAHLSLSKGTVHVKRDKDGKTVTLYKVSTEPDVQ